MKGSMSFRLATALMFLSVALCSPRSAWSDPITLYDSISGGYDAYFGMRITGQYPNGEPDLTHGVRFSPVASGYMTESRLVIFTESGTSAFRLMLFDDAGGTVGSLMAEVDVTGNFDAYGGQAFEVATAWASAPYLSAGQNYWLIGAPPLSGFANLGWAISNQSAVALTVYRWDSGTWEYSSPWPPPAFVLSGQTSSVPEPASLLLLGTGLVGAVGVMRKRRQ